MTSPGIDRDPRTDVTRLLDDLERQASGDVHNRLVAAVRAGLALHVASHAWCVVCDRDRDVERLGNNPDCEHRASFCRACDTSWPCATYRALWAPLGQHTTDEEG